MELVRFPSRGGFSVRSIFTFVLAVIAAALLWATLSGTHAHAAPEARWGGDAIILDNRGFTEVSDLTDASNTIPKDATVYRTPAQTVGTGSNAAQKVFVIYFSAGVDPPTATTAQYVEFDYKNNTASNPQNKKDIELEVKSAQTSQSSCVVEGVGWFICPISVFLADAMDNIFSILATMIETQPPILGDSTNSMYIAWNIMRTIANVAFVIAFLIIIYSQLTSMGVSNYGLKRLIPRLIVAAILVNISFYIAALAIDISNILGYSIQDILNSIRESVFHITAENAGVMANPWATVTGVVLAGGGIFAGVWYAATGGLYLLLPLLLGLLLTIILVVLILAARQAIILILVIIAPLAFVANLLPNTEKWFDKWKDLFMTMLIFFPAFSLVFGGSQLAGQMIIQNAGSQGAVNNIVMLIFGLAVQIAPLVITPLILKLSGGLLGRIAQIANDPKKGLIDRNRNWAQRRAEHAREHNIATGPRLRNPASWGAGAVRASEFRKRRLNDKTEMWKQAATNRYEETAKYGRIHEDKADVDENKERIHRDHAAHIEELKATPGTRLHATAMRSQVSKDHLERAQQNLGAYYNAERIRTGSNLNISNNALETAKSYNEASEQDKNAYLNEQRTFRVSQLGAAAERLEAAKLNAEGWQSEYTAHIDTLKLSPTSQLGDVARFAQSSKEHSEAAQHRVQAMFDRDRQTVGSELHHSTINLENAKSEADTAKTQVTGYLNNERANFDGLLHVNTMRNETAKIFATESDERLKRIVSEYKTGKLDLDEGTELHTLMTEMTASVTRVAAEARGAQAAQNIQQGNISSDFMADTPEAEALIQTAASVDPHGALRARAAATSQLSKIEKEALDNNIVLLKSAAEDEGVPDIAWARTITEKHRGVFKDADGNILPPEPQDDGLLEAAYDVLAADGDIGTLREGMMDTNFDDPEGNYKSMMGRVLARNNGSLKGKGGFDLQQKLGKLWNASQEEMDRSVAFSLGAVGPENIPGQKWGWWYSYTDERKRDAEGRVPLERIVANVQSMPEGDTKDLTMGQLRSAYANITTALSDPQIMSKLGDRKEETGKMHRILHELFQDPRLEIDYSLTDNGIADDRDRRMPS